MLPIERFEDASFFIKRNARTLDISLFKYYFEDGSKEDVIQELGRFQNGDGGFGHAIEPDFRLKSSSPMATSVGLQYFHEVDGPRNHALVQSAIDYLVSTYDDDLKFWPATFKDVNDAPHAPWWHVEKIVPPDGVDWANPSVELAGYLNMYSDLVPSDMLEAVNTRITSYLKENKIIGSWLYNIMCLERVYACFPPAISSLMESRIIESFNSLVPLTQERLGEIRIFWLAPKATSFLTKVDSNNVRELLTNEISRQSKDGGWWPTWKWGMYEDVWSVAEKEWAGKMTVKCLHTLSELDMIEN